MSTGTNFLASQQLTACHGYHGLIAEIAEDMPFACCGNTVETLQALRYRTEGVLFLLHWNLILQRPGLEGLQAPSIKKCVGAVAVAQGRACQSRPWSPESCP